MECFSISDLDRILANSWSFAQIHTASNVLVFRLNYQINDTRRPQRFMYTRKDSIFVIGRDNLNVTKHGIQTKNKQLSIITWLQEVRFRPNMFERNKLQFFTTFNCEISNNHQITCMTSQRKMLQFGTSLKEMTIQETKLLHALLDDT